MLRTERAALRSVLRRSPWRQRAAATHATFSPPTAGPMTDRDVETLVGFVEAGDGRTVIITGAGVSTESGIPDYRSPLGSYSRGHKPMQHREFVTSAAARQRYWARSLTGFARMAAARPNDCHDGLAELEKRGWIQSVITQNVDSLHRKAGSEQVVDLHGVGDQTQCLSCGARGLRDHFHTRLAEANSAWMEATAVSRAEAAQVADGDAALDDDVIGALSVPVCDACNDGVVMPAVVFFGGAIPPEVKTRAAKEIESASRVLALGSSLQTFSAYSLCRDAVKSGKPLCVVCIGDTRADPLLSVKLSVSCGAAVRALCSELPHRP
eukprot:TRINITY_DN35396_c0_g1_i1.p1 TRINITY_DN35396_c0_g1~~TRINITY_DN35396_c0_g1_i1.p1  ORF type:complete len:324 (+),score=77.99 TRINITY_DN35396_c0_g1_i1:58-1029(+)